MSTPKITPRVPRIIRVEDDPYIHPHWSYIGICRKTYEDGHCALFVGDTPVRAIRYDFTDSRMHPNISLHLVGGGPDSVVCLNQITSQERAWLEESMED